jgi:hypothetical protein
MKRVSTCQLTGNVEIIEETPKSFAAFVFSKESINQQ